MIPEAPGGDLPLQYAINAGFSPYMCMSECFIHVLSVA